MEGDLMRESVTISLSKDIKKKLDSMAKEERANRRDIVKEALRQYFAVVEFQKIRKNMLPKAEAAGIFDEEDVYKTVS